MKNLAGLIGLIFILLPFTSVGQNDFITTWQTTTPNESITIPTRGGGYNYSVNWGDGNTLSGYTGDATHTYATAGTYTVTISGTFPRIYFSGLGDKDKIIAINQWGTGAWTSMSRAFRGCSNLVGLATDTPNLTNVTDMSSMFRDCSVFNQNIGNWNVSNVENMSYMFRGASAFNSNLDSWVVSNVDDMSYMFNRATSFNENVGSWNVANVRNMAGMFSNATAFNKNLNGWNVGNVTDMSSMFATATSFNRNIGSWNTANVTDMRSMFQNAFAFDQDIGMWNVGKVTNMRSMFSNAQVFNQDIGGWDVSKVQDMYYMFANAGQFNQDLGSWNVGMVQDMNGMFRYAVLFNQDIGMWNVSNVVQFYGMFLNATAFNQDIGGWNTGSATQTTIMFSNATSFNQDIGSWNMSNVVDMSSMFRGATAFNQDIGSWNLGSATYIPWMFQDATSFNQDIGNWDVADVTNMRGMFQGATSFDQDIGGWNVEKVTTMQDMFTNATLSMNNYDSLLIGWGTQTLQSNVLFSGGNSTYCNGEIYRDNMITIDNWTITDAGKDVMCQLLPVTWASPLTAQLDRGKTHLQWEVSHLVNHDKFVIQHSIDGQTFSSVGEISGQESGLYEFTHSSPTLGPNYYQVQQMDVNGQSSYSRMVKVMVKEKSFSLFPNPMKEVVWVNSPEDSWISIYSGEGYLVLHKTIKQGLTEIDIKDLPVGIYLVDMENGGSWKVVKQ